MLFRLPTLLVCLMTTPRPTFWVRMFAMVDGMKGRNKVIYAYGKAYSIVTDQLSTPTEAYNAKEKEERLRRLDMNGDILKRKYINMSPTMSRYRYHTCFHGQYYTKSRSQCYTE